MVGELGGDRCAVRQRARGRAPRTRPKALRGKDFRWIALRTLYNIQGRSIGARHVWKRQE